MVPGKAMGDQPTKDNLNMIRYRARTSKACFGGAAAPRKGLSTTRREGADGKEAKTYKSKAIG